MVAGIGWGVWGSQGPQGPGTAATNFYNFPKIRHSKSLPTSSQIKILKTVGPWVVFTYTPSDNTTKLKSKGKNKTFLVSLVWWILPLSPLDGGGTEGTLLHFLISHLLFSVFFLIYSQSAYCKERLPFRGRSGHRALSELGKSLKRFAFLFFLLTACEPEKQQVRIYHDKDSPGGCLSITHQKDLRKGRPWWNYVQVFQVPGSPGSGWRAPGARGSPRGTGRAK